MCNNKNKQGFKMIDTWTIPFGMFIEEITRIEDIEDAEWEEDEETTD